MKKFAQILFLSALLLLPQFVAAEDIVVLTEEIPPYNYEEDGQAFGISTEIFLLMAKRADLDIKRSDIRVWPWARAYSDIQEEDNVILYSMLRTKERENLFQWIGPILPLRSVVVALKKDNIKITDLDKAIQRLCIGTVRDNASEEFLIRHGADPTRLERVHTLKLNVKKLIGGRIDVMVGLDIALKQTIKDMGMSFKDDFEIVHTIMAADLYFAASKNMNPDIVSSLQDALDKLKADGTMEAIINKATN